MKVSDFGLSRIIPVEARKSAHSMSHVGNQAYWAPEVGMRKGYSQSADIYSIGIIIYELLTGKLPPGDKVPVQHVLSKGLWSDERHTKEFSLDAMLFLQSALQKDPTRRPTAEKLELHPFLRNPSTAILCSFEDRVKAVSTTQSSFVALLKSGDVFFVDACCLDNPRILLTPPEVRVRAECMATFGDSVAVGYASGTIKVWNAQTGRVEAKEEADEKAKEDGKAIGWIGMNASFIVTVTQDGRTVFTKSRRTTKRLRTNPDELAGFRPWLKYPPFDLSDIPEESDPGGYPKTVLTFAEGRQVHQYCLMELTDGIHWERRRQCQIDLMRGSSQIYCLTPKLTGDNSRVRQ